ncbi:MAG: right-handed parallel beta-helix repeat-containing protein [Opitutaceae bacterium]|nr:right-handed parallel beta-helix repeat-containing protein [Opitutaceae bacterium]
MRVPHILVLFLLGMVQFGSPLAGMIDRNHDRVSDLWAERHPGIGPLDGDSDGDGASDRAEALAGTDPTVAGSRLAAVPHRQSDGTLALRWHGVSGKRYQIESSSDLVTWAAQPGVFAGLGAELQTDGLAVGSGPEVREFWRVVVGDVDTDGEGLNDWEEAQVGTSATQSDTDADGQSDAAEVLAGTDPLNAPASGDTYYLDADAGDDDTGDGSAARPWRTFKKALYSVQSGDTVLLRTGHYGTLIAGRTKDDNRNWGAEVALPLAHFTDWVTFKAAPGHAPRATRIDFGTKNTTERTSNNLAVQLPFTVKGNVDLFIRVDGLIIEDGVDLKGGRHIEIANCTINRAGPLNDSISSIDNKGGVGISNGRYITIRGNDITQVAVGIGGASHDLAIIANRIHNIAHDGIRVLGGDTWLIEGNWIHDLDDGFGDPANYPAEVRWTWGRHADGIHIWTLTDATRNLTVRGNIIYHVECMGVMVNASTLAGKEYSNWVFENNVFGPTGAEETIHGGAAVRDRFIFRHNTFVYAPEDRWTGLYPKDMVTGEDRVIHSTTHKIMWPSCDGEGSVYNNLFADGSQARVYTGSPLSFSGHNLYRIAPTSGNALSRGDAVLTALPYDAIPGNVQDYMDASGKVIGQLTAQNQAIDAGTGIGLDYVTALKERLTIDFLETTRDARADIGAFEVPGRNPVAEVYDFLPEPAVPLHFVDNFTDTRIDLQDPFLNTADTTGIRWHMPEGYARFRTMNGGSGDLVLSTVYENKPAIVVTSKRFANVTFSFDFSRPLSDCGLIVLYQNPDDYYFFDFGGRFLRRLGGVETVVATMPAPSGGRATLVLSIEAGVFNVSFAAGGTYSWTHSEAAPFPGGAVGFYRNRTTGNGWDRTDYDNVRVDLATADDLIGDLAP